MKKKLAFIAAAALLLSAGCGQINDPAAEADENTTVTEPETTTAEETTEAATEAATEEETTAATTAAPVTTAETPGENSAAARINVLSELRMGMTEEEVFSVIGDKFDYRYDAGSKPSIEYDYTVVSDEIFGTGLRGYMFAEFDAESHTLICCGYHLGAVGNAAKSDHPYSEAELTDGYGMVTETLTAGYGEGIRPEEYTGEGIIDEMSWSDGSDQLWAIYGTDLWDTDSSVNEIIVSRSIES